MSIPSRSGGKDTKVETQGLVTGVHIKSFDAVGNLFAVVMREDGQNPLWTINVSMDDGVTWNETFKWNASSTNKIRDLTITTHVNHVFIGYVVEDGVSSFNLARVRRTDSAGLMDNSFFWKEVFDKGDEIKEIAIVSQGDNIGPNSLLYFFAVLKNQALLCHISSDDGYSWGESHTGIKDAVSGLDAVCTLDAKGAPKCLAVSYCHQSTQVAIAMPISGKWTVTLMDVMLPFSSTAISGYDDNIIAVYRDPSMTGIRYSASSNAGASWTSGDVVKASSHPTIYYSPDVTARKGGGVSVTYHEETGEPDTCWHTHCDYGSYNWSPHEPYNEVDVITGTDMSIDWIPSLSGSDEYGMLWISDDAKRYTYFDRIDTLVEPLSVDCYSICSEKGRTINFSLDAGSSNAFRNYIVLASVTGTDPGIPLPGGYTTLPLNWDVFTSLVVSMINTPAFKNFHGKFDASGMGSAQLNTGPVPKFAIGLRIYFAFCTNKPFNFASNSEEIRILP